MGDLSRTLFILTCATFLVYECLCCQCSFGKPKQKYCQADWVARTKVLDFHEVNVTKLSDGLLRAHNIEYKVKYLKVFKIPTELNGTLPNVVYTPSVDALCGIFLDKGKEYLLSGRIYDDQSVTTLCGQILFEDRHRSMENDVLLWSEVPKNLSLQLEKRSFEPCPTGLV